MVKVVVVSAVVDLRLERLRERSVLVEVRFVGVRLVRNVLLESVGVVGLLLRQFVVEDFLGDA